MPAAPLPGFMSLIADGSTSPRQEKDITAKVYQYLGITLKQSRLLLLLLKTKLPCSFGILEKDCICSPVAGGSSFEKMKPVWSTRTLYKLSKLPSAVSCTRIPFGDSRFSERKQLIAPAKPLPLMHPFAVPSGSMLRLPACMY